MQVNAPFHPPNRPHPDMSPASTAGSEWSGMNNYNGFPPRTGASFGGPPPRGDSMSPPDSSGSMGGRPPFRGNTFGPGFSPTDPMLPPAPRPGSRASSRAGSIAHSRSSDGTIADKQSRKYLRMEAELRQHYAVLRSYLKGGSSNNALPKNKARDKLLRLSPVQFHELSTDVFDELQRRQAAAPLPGRPPRGKVPPFLQPRREFHEKRNQARQKLSSLQTSRFKDLSSDVFFEIERRFPQFNPDGKRDSNRSQSRGPGGRAPGPNGFAPPPRAHTEGGSMGPGQNGYGDEQSRPTQKQFQSNTVTPYKSTMVEDDDDEEGAISHYARSSDAFGLESALTSPRSGEGTSGTSYTGGSRDMKGHPPNSELQEKVFELETKLQAKDDEIRELSTGSKLKEDLEHKLEDADKLNKSLQDELDQMQAEFANMERNLRSQLTSAKIDEQDSEWRGKHNELEREHRSLRSKYDEQLRTTEAVSKQFKAHLVEMRAMAQESGNGMEREEKLHHEVQRLGDELKDWKTRYAKAKTQLRSTRTSTLGLNVKRPELGGGFHQSNGLVKDVNVTRFQIAIDELLKAARSDDPSAVLEYMKAVIISVRSITGDVEMGMTEDKDEESYKRKAKLKGKVSATANNVITACKNFVAAGGLSPVSLLDAAASHLTSAVVDLVRIVKIRPSPPGELEDADEPTMTPVNNAGYFDVSETLRRRSAADSVYSALSDPPEEHQSPQVVMHAHSTSGVINGYANSAGLGINPGLQADETELEELKVYLNNQTDLMVQSVQSLVTSVRNEDMMPIVRNHISTIVDIAENVVGASEGGMEDASSFQTSLTSAIYKTVNNISKCRDQLEQAGIESQKHDGQASAKQFSQGLPPLAFQIARELKELVSKTDGVMAGEQPGDDDFS